MPPEAQSSVTQGISFPPELLEGAKDAADKDSRSLSSYIQNLVRRDLERAKAEELAKTATEVQL